MKLKRSRSLLAKFRRLFASRAAVRRAAVEALEDRQLLTAWYVSTAGAPSNNGSLNQPFPTIQAAANVAQPGDIVYIMGGVYRETVTPPTSGTATAPVTFEPYNGQSVTIDGADPITGWSQYQGPVYEAPLPWDLGEGNNQVFVDGTMVNEARWPNTPANIASPTTTAPANISTPTWATATSVNVTLATAPALSTVTIHNSSLNQVAGTWVGSIAHIAAGQQWLDQVGTITASSPGSITVSYLNETSYQVPQAGNPFYIVGNFKALDSAGEWYRDPVSGNLFVWDPSGDSPTAHTVEAKARDYGFDLSGASNIDVTGINLFACTINTDANSSNNVLNGISAQYVSQSIGITPDTLDPWGAKLHPHTTGIILNGTGNILENSTIAFSSGDGVFLGGSGNTVENTVIHDVDYEAGDEAGVSSLGTDETILNNTIYNAGRSGIVFRYTYGSLISHNVIHTVGLQTTDLAGIYTWGTDGAGTEISYNVVYGVHTGGYGGAGIYLDNSSQDFIVDHNLVFDSDIALKLNPPSWDNLIVNNTFVGTQYAVQSSGNEDMTGDVLINNIFSGATMFGSTATRSNNIYSPTNPNFVSTSQSNYQLQSNSPAINFGKADLPFTANVIGATPDAGAYEYGMMPFAAGATAQPFMPTATFGNIAALTTPAITWPTPSSIRAGTPLGVSQLDATAPIPGTFVFTPAAGTLLGGGNGQTLSATFTPFDTDDYASVTVSVTINVIPLVVPAITWANPATIDSGTALTVAQLNATTTVAGAFVYTPAVGTILGPGNAQTLSVTFTPADTADYASSTASVAINIVQPTTPAITWANPAAISYGTALDASELNATTSVAGAFVYSQSAGRILGAGNAQTLSVTFTPTDTIDYTTATASVAINVLPATPGLTWLSSTALHSGTALGPAQLDATSTVPGTFVYTPAAGTILPTGSGQTLSVTFTPTDAVDYTAATATTTIDVTLAAAPPTISWANPSAIVYGSALGAAQLDATSPIPGIFVYTPALGTILQAGAAQTLSVTFTPTDTADYTSTTASATVDVAQAVLTVTAKNAARIYGAANPSFAYAITGFVNGDTSNVVAGAPNLSTSANASSPTGIYSIDVANGTLAAGNYTFNPVAGNLTVSAATSHTSVVSSGSAVVGQPVTFTATITPSSGTNPTGTMQFLVNGSNAGSPVTVSGGIASYTTSALPIGTETITAVYSGSGNFTGSASSAISQTIKASPTLTTLTTSSATTVFGQPVTFTANVFAAGPGGGTPTGTVTFKNGTAVLKAVTLVNGTATLTMSSLSVASHSITAVYSAGSSYTASTSAPLTQIVKQSTVIASLSSSAATLAAGQTLTLTATIKPAYTAAGDPTGTVTFKIGSVIVGTATISGNKATFTTKALAKGTYQITAVYNGSSNFLAGVSPAITQVIT